MGVTRMIRLPLARTAVAGVLVLGMAAAGTAQEPKQGLTQQTQKINELIAKSWEDAGIKKHAANATDLEFARRAFIDLIGRIPTADEVIDFENDKAAGKRPRLVARLLNADKYTPKGAGGKPAVSGPVKVPTNYADEYAEHWADIWTVWLMSRSGHDLYQIGRAHV